MSSCGCAAANWSGISIFNQAIVLDYFDTSLAGVVTCGMCGSSFYFSVVATSDEEDERVYSLAEVPRELVSNLKEFLSRFHQPQFPEWVVKWKFPDEQSKDAAEKIVDGIITARRPPRMLVLGGNITGEIRTIAVDPDILDAAKSKELDRTFGALRRRFS